MRSKKSKTTRVPIDIVERAEEISDRLGVPKTRAFNILFSSENENQLVKAVQRSEEELYNNLVLEFDEEEVKDIIEGLNLGVILRNILAPESKEVRDDRRTLLREKIVEFIREISEEDNNE